MPVADTELARSRRHELGKSGGPCRAEGHGVEAGLCPDQSTQQIGWQSVAALGFGDRFHVKVFPEGNVRSFACFDRRQVLAARQNLSLRLRGDMLEKGKFLCTGSLG